eukprot:scaffold15721_cov38-Phaeocystis_antarctica.AAC.2
MQGWQNPREWPPRAGVRCRWACACATRAGRCPCAVPYGAAASHVATATALGLAEVDLLGGRQGGQVGDDGQARDGVGELPT